MTLADRLRELALEMDGDEPDSSMLLEAAAEIERLEDDLEAARGASS